MKRTYACVFQEDDIDRRIFLTDTNRRNCFLFFFNFIPVFLSPTPLPLFFSLSLPSPFPPLLFFLLLSFLTSVDFVIALEQESGNETGCPPAQDVTSELPASTVNLPDCLQRKHFPLYASVLLPPSFYSPYRDSPFLSVRSPRSFSCSTHLHTHTHTHLAYDTVFWDLIRFERNEKLRTIGVELMKDSMLSFFFNEKRLLFITRCVYTIQCKLGVCTFVNSRWWNGEACSKKKALEEPIESPYIYPREMC